MITHKILADLEQDIIREGIFFIDYKGFSFSDLVQLAHIGLAYKEAKEDITTDMILVSDTYHSAELKPTNLFPKRTAPEVY